jgi:hypothetical protein
VEPRELAIEVADFGPQTGNPLIFGGHAELRKLGIEIANFGPEGARDLPEKCGGRYGGEGRYDFTFSHEFAQKFRSRGFTNLTLCMAMESRIRYNPETGARLRSFVLADIPKIKRNQGEAGTATDQIPLDVPDCFKNAMPLQDCKLNFDMMGGRRLTSDQARKLRNAGINALAHPGDDNPPVAIVEDDRHLPKGRGYVLYNEGPGGREPLNDTLTLIKKR